MTNEELELRFSRLVKTERKITVEILGLICEAEQRKHYAPLGFCSLFDWLTRGHRYSSPAASRRIQAARRLKESPHIAGKIESGALNLSTIARLQTAIMKQERKRSTFPKERAEELLAQIENKTVDEVDRILAAAFPQKLKHEVLKYVDGESARLHLNLESKTLASLKRCRDLLAHARPNATWADIIEYVIIFYLNKKDPLRRRSLSVVQRVK